MNIQNQSLSRNDDHISVIVPVLNEKQNLPKLLEQLGHFSFKQIIIVDGGSTDASWQWLEEYKVNSGKGMFDALQSNTGRANQMNTGAQLAKSKYLLFLHADSELPDNADTIIASSLKDHIWGRFDIEFKESDWRMPIVAWFMNWRSRLTGIATGDQAIFIRRRTFEQMHGFAQVPLMEDVELCKRLIKISKPVCLREKVTTSARRWLSKGVIRTVFLMWRLRWEYFIGADLDKLANKYRQVR